MAIFHLQIVTPDKMVYDGEAKQVTVRTVEGEVSILERHIDYAAPLGVGEARITDSEGKLHTGACNGGMISVSGGDTRIIATTFEWAEEINAERAEQARDMAEARLKELKPKDEDYAIMEAKLKRALLRIKVKR